MKRNIISLLIILSLIIVCLFGAISKNSNVYENKNTIKNNKSLDVVSMMLETMVDSGEYQESKESSWPSDGYTFNSTLSKCENGGALSWDDSNKRVIMSGNKSDKCYVYFDKVPDAIKLADYVKSLYTGTQGENNLYLHDSTLENGAGDGSYRYAGSSETTNNFVYIELLVYLMIK